MAHFDVTVADVAPKPSGGGYKCLLTEKPCGLVPVTLRKMVLIPPLWVGRKVTLELPLSETPSLAPWQYIRMVRWMVTLLLGGATTKRVFSFFGTENLGIYLTVLVAIVVCFWIVIGVL
jgi:hypothetical protein